MQNKRVTIIIPVCNGEHCLRECLNSVFSQTVAAAQVIVVNDGSTDRTADVARGYGDRIVYLEQANAGQGAARNTGLMAAHGEFIAFLDADDFWKPAFLERCMTFLDTHPNCVAVNTGLITRMQDGTEVRQPVSLTGAHAPVDPFVIDDFFAFWAEHDHVRTGSVLIRKSVIDRAGGQQAALRVSQDLEYWGFIATFGSWGYIPEPLWVGNSRAAAARSGWLQKYRQRRKLCPTVEQWQERLLPRLTSAQLPHFKKVRGRVANGYAQNHILGGNSAQARQIVQAYGSEMPRNKLTRLLNTGHKLGTPAWWMACRIVLARETIKARMVQSNR